VAWNSRVRYQRILAAKRIQIGAAEADHPRLKHHIVFTRRDLVDFLDSAPARLLNDKGLHAGKFSEVRQGSQPFPSDSVVYTRNDSVRFIDKNDGGPVSGN
jgi:hypothetical protein